jgi:hypothetical protein
MPKDSKVLIGASTILASAAVATVIGMPILEDAVSPCFDHPVSAAMCRAAPPDMADNDEKEPAPLQVRHTLAIATSSTASPSGRSIAAETGRYKLTGFATRS